ncbi:MAG TPA: O-antigen ligase family protein [Pyrinomonadaceae bacterium]|nr:O-antigen ligase family protein [Pyrinomonadaceae bacterium]
MTKANKVIFFLLCGSLVFFTLAYGTVHQPTISLFYLVVTTMTILWAANCLYLGDIKLSRHPLQIPLYAAFLYALIQLIPFGTVAETAGVAGIPRTISMSPFDTEMTAYHVLALGLFFSVSLSTVDSAARIRKLVGVILVFGFIFAFFSILQSFLSPGKIYGIYERVGAFPFGSFVSRNNFAAFMEMLIALPLGLLLSGAIERDKRLIYITAIGLMGVALVLSGSRGGLVAMLAGVVLLIMITTRASGGKKLVLRIAMSVVMLGVIVGGSYYIGGDSSLTRIAETTTSKDVTTDRTHIWGITLKIIGANFPLGAGIGAFAQAYTPFDDRSGLERVEQAHNDYLQVLADAGIVGAAIAGFFLFVLFRTIKRNIARENKFRRGVAIGATAGIFAILVHSIFDFVLHTTSITLLFILLLVLLVASGRKYDDDVPNDDDRGQSRRRSKGSVMPFSRRSNA